MRRSITTLLFAATLGGCGHIHTDVKELKTVSFSDDISKGKSNGQIEADDCVFKLFGYALGDMPDVSKAIANARTMKTANLTDVVASPSGGGTALRYVNNVTVKPSGFDAYIIGKHCLKVTAVGYL